MTMRLKVMQAVFVMATLIGSTLGLAFGQTTSCDPGLKPAANDGREQDTTISTGPLKPAPATPTHIGQHQIGETLQEWREHEPVSSQVQSGIAPHKIEETFAEWLRLNQLDLVGICQKHHERDEHHTDFKAVCRNLSAIRDTGHGESYTTDQMGHTLGWTFSAGVLAGYSIDGKQPNVEQLAASMANSDDFKITKTSSREFIWDFANGKLSQVTVTPSWEAIGLLVPDFREEVDLLTQVYGKPSTVTAVPYHNAFGAQWERSELAWRAPDGTRIVAFERTGFDQQGNSGEYLFTRKNQSRRSSQRRRSRIRTNSEGRQPY